MGVGGVIVWTGRMGRRGEAGGQSVSLDHVNKSWQAGKKVTGTFFKYIYIFLIFFLVVNNSLHCYLYLVGFHV